MCGIYGTTLNYTKAQVEKKLQRMAFRGPDQMGISVYKNEKNQLILGHNRLSIIDLDPRSNQPFSYLNKIHIVFNGEIYNFQELKIQLLSKGYKFSTTSDTEVICAAYLEYGSKCVDRFVGMFAFVIFDEQKQILFGARDRLGKKPFYYYHNQKEFEFASQISPIQLFRNDLTISQKSIAYYLAWSSVPEPMSIFNQIKKLRPGYSFIYNLETGSFEENKYWDISYQYQKQFSGTYKEAQDSLKEILKNAVSSRLYADVPVGVFLSGGIDSSLVAAIASETSKNKINTFSVKFNESGFDESIFAKKVANHLQTNHHVIECNYKEGLELIENFTYYYDEPFADSSAIPSMLLAKYTRKQVTVALSGDGGDESFLGYYRYFTIKKGDWLYMAPKILRSTAAKFLRLVPAYKLKVIAKALNYNSINEFYMATITGIDLSYTQHNYDVYNFEERKYLDHQNKNLYERMSDFDIKTYLNWHINTKVDRATMAFSLEPRAPLMDHRLIEFARTLPSNFKFEGNNQKRILKDILYEYVPADFFNRPKAGFAMPFEVWFREDLKDMVLSELNDESLKNIPCINQKIVKFMINQHMNHKWNRYPLIWKLLVLKKWLKVNGEGLSIV